MSVLNKMLRDLEQRQHPSTATRMADIAKANERPLWLNILLLLSFLLLCFAVYAILTRQPLPAVAVNTDTGVQQPAAATPLPAAAQADTQSTSAAKTSVAATPAVAVTKTGLTGAAAAVAAVPPAETVAVAEPETSVAATASPQTTATAVTSLPPAVKTDETPASSTETTPAQQQAVVQIARTEVSAEQRAALLQQQALAAAQAGRLQQALRQWQQLQQLTPQDASVYLQQARLWQQLGQPAQAVQVLQQALRQNIMHADIQLLLAQQAAAQAQWQQVDTLLPARFTVAEQPEYYGLKATALQQLGQQQAALQWFSQLIVLQPQQARWWLGAAIAFDTLAQREQAQLHYRQALQWGDSLTDASRNYIQQRLAATE